MRRPFLALDEMPKTWVHLAVLQVVGEEGLVAERLQVSHSNAPRGSMAKNGVNKNACADTWRCK